MKGKLRNAIALTATASSIVFSASLTARAQSGGSYYAGTAAGGQSITVDLDSVSSASQYRANFIYYLGNERVPSQASCAGGGSWMALDTGVVYQPQSSATRNMLDAVCSRLANINQSTQTALVHEPPSNVRAAPNGAILCAVSTQSYINVYGRTGAWYLTDACGQTGYIHNSQIVF